MLKKCPNITSIELDGRRNIVHEVFQLIIENCNNLSEIIILCAINNINSNLKGFCRKFGPKMKFIFPIDIWDLNRFPNIEKVKINYMYDHSTIAKLEQAKLKQLEVGILEGEEHTLQTIIDTFRTLTHLNLYIRYGDENGIYNSLKNISNLKHLIHFKLSFGNQFRINNNRFCDLFKQMSNNCQNLKSIGFGFKINHQNSDIRQLLSQLKAFPPLKRLNLLLIFFNDEKDINVNQIFSFELFKGFENMTHLRLYFDLEIRRKTLKESVLKDIDINLPNLQYLKISDYFDTTPEGVTQMADILSRLSRLETIELKFKSGVDFKPIEEQITKKCKEIRKIEINT